jgi:hypothetical protein
MRLMRSSDRQRMEDGFHLLRQAREELWSARANGLID